MTTRSKKIIGNYFKKIKIHEISIKDKTTFVKSVIGFVCDMEKSGLLDKMKYCYPFINGCPVKEIRGVSIDFDVE